MAGRKNLAWLQLAVMKSVKKQVGAKAFCAQLNTPQLRAFARKHKLLPKGCGTGKLDGYSRRLGKARKHRLHKRKRR